MRRSFAALPLALCLFAYALPASGEIIQLIDGTKVSGTIVHYFDGVYSIDTADGRIKIPKEKIKLISFELPPPRAEFSTPEKAFEVWRKAMVAGNLEAAVDCYALMYQGMILSSLTDAG